MSDGMGREFAYLSSHANNRYFIPNWGSPYTIYTVEGIKKLSKTTTFFKIYRKNIQRLLVFHKAIG